MTAVPGPGTSAAEPAPGRLVSTLACPQCGAVNSLPSGERVVRCAFCDAALFIDRSGLVSHYRLPRLLDQGQALEALRRWMAGNETVKDLDRLAKITAAEAVSFPMWMFRSHRQGAGETVRIEPAAATPVGELADLALPAGKLEAYKPEAGAEAVAASVPLETARSWLGPSGEQLTETALVHLPLWRCRYRYGEQDFLALVEASTGAVLAAVFPAKAESPYYVTTVVGVLLFLIEGFLFSNPFLKLFAYLLTGLPLALIAYWVTRKV